MKDRMDGSIGGFGSLLPYPGRLRPSVEAPRELLVLEIDQIKLDLRRAEFRLKQHDEQEALRKEQAEQVSKWFDPEGDNVNHRMGAVTQFRNSPPDTE